MQNSASESDQRLPRVPESLEVLRARFPNAIRRVWDASGAKDTVRRRFQQDRPGIHREHVFDFYSGLRLIVARERSDESLYIHVSASLQASQGSGKFEGLLKAALKALGLDLAQRSYIATTNAVVHITFSEAYTLRLSQTLGAEDAP